MCNVLKTNFNDYNLYQNKVNLIIQFKTKLKLKLNKKEGQFLWSKYNINRANGKHIPGGSNGKAVLPSLHDTVWKKKF